MCGITGYLGLQDKKLLKQMTSIMAHRGPDAEGLFCEGNIGLGHKRLSILDLSDLGRQPMVDKNSRVVITYNGELYNFNELRVELEKMGFVFSSKTDTEVVLNSYLAWGEECLSKFNGMFAFAIWNRDKKQLFLARDRVGIKPLYFTKQNNTFLFGSEIKSILCCPTVKREVNTRALDYFFTFRFNQLDETLFKGIYKLPPGHFLKCAITTNRDLDIQMRQYWDISFSKKLPFKPKEITEELAQRFKKSVDAMMVSDVPVGTFLSSGVDSSTITAIMKKELGKATPTFTVGFGYQGFEDELTPVRYTTDYYQTKHTEYICKPDMISLLPKIVWSLDELNADPALIPTYLISEQAKKSVKVVLSGEGADELFGGYERTLMMKYAWRTAQFSPHLLTATSNLIDRIPVKLLDSVFKYSSSIGSKGMGRLAKFCENISNNLGASYLDVAGVFNQQEKDSFYCGAMLSRLKEENIADTINAIYFPDSIQDSEELFSRLANLELKTRLPNDLLAKVDSMTMAHSLEGRVPYLDHTFVEYSFAIPSSLKIRYFREKYILRQAAKKYLPMEIIKRRKDHFFVPIHLWLQKELRTTVDKILSPENIAKTGYINAKYIDEAYRNYKKGGLFYARQLWNVLFFMIWHKIYIETDLFLSMADNPMTLQTLFAKG